jgi:hypothetical protein
MTSFLFTVKSQSLKRDSKESREDLGKRSAITSEPLGDKRAWLSYKKACKLPMQCTDSIERIRSNPEESSDKSFIELRFSASPYIRY